MSHLLSLFSRGLLLQESKRFSEALHYYHLAIGSRPTLACKCKKMCLIWELTRDEEVFMIRREMWSITTCSLTQVNFSWVFVCNNWVWESALFIAALDVLLSCSVHFSLMGMMIFNLTVGCTHVKWGRVCLSGVMDSLQKGQPFNKNMWCALNSVYTQSADYVYINHPTPLNPSARSGLLEHRNHPDEPGQPGGG